VHTVHLEDLGSPRSLEVLRAVFFDPDQLRPGVTSQAVTEEAARHVGEIAQGLRDRGFAAEAVAHFLHRLVFCMFAEDAGLLPDRLFTRVAENARNDPERFQRQVAQLFAAMADGGDFGAEVIRHFDGGLFGGDGVLPLTEPEIAAVLAAATLDWGAVDASIFGTLFERGLDPGKRAQLGAHYTSREDIETLVGPVVMQPLRREWAEARELVGNLMATGKKHPTPDDVGAERASARRGSARSPLAGGALTKATAEARIILDRFLDRLAAVTVLDPACGSGNFLYVTLQKLKDLEKEAILFGMEHGLGFFPRVGPWQLYGIEVNRYAFELAQMTVWIGYLQWIRFNGFEVPADPILRPMDTFRCMDAILDLSDPEHPTEPEWPSVDFIVGNPPFLGGKLLRRGLGDHYVEQLFSVWRDRVPPEADLCCYWFEKARAQVEAGHCERAGLLGTQGVRGGANRKVVERIKHSGDIFFAESDRPWVLDGANVHVSMVGFDDGRESERQLDGQLVAEINANLTTAADLTAAARLRQNLGLSFMGDTKAGSFELDDAEALSLLRLPNPHGRPSSDVLVPWVNGLDITRRPRSLWIIDFGPTMPEDQAALYERPFALVFERVRPDRQTNKRDAYRVKWWLHAEARSGMRTALVALPRFLVTPRVTKYRLFVWLGAPTLPDSQVFAFSLVTDAAFGVLHSRVHEAWARAQGTQLRERESGFRYTPTTCFETFPFPWPPGEEPPGDPRVEAIADAARDLDELRRRWLDPPEWTREEVLGFPGSADGPWARYVHDPDERGIGTVRWPRLVPRDADCAEKLKARTLTNLYNQRPTWLAHAHATLDAAVLAAYGWPADLADEALLERLLALNLERAGVTP